MEYPEHEKMKKVQDKSHDIGAFLEWLLQEHEIARYDKREELIPVHKSIEKWLSEYFNIDLNKIEKEKRAMLKSLRGK